MQRITKFVKYLPQHGWTPFVLTPRKPPGSFPVDESYLRDVPPSVKVFTAPSFEPYHIYRALGGKKRQDSADFRGVLEGGKSLGILGRAYAAFQAAFLIPDPKIGWFRPAVKQAGRVLREHRIDLIFSTSPEATDHVIGRALARKTGLPWVMDFRDPWTTSLYAIRRPGWARRKEEQLELSCLTEASAVTVVQERYRDEYLAKYPSLREKADKFIILPNGYDPEDWERITPRDFDRWTVVYTGSISYPRDPEPFFKAWKLACEKSRDFSENAGCLFMGEFDSRFRELAAKYIMQSLTVEGFRPREEVLAAQMGAGALLLISEGYVTGKVYEYLASRRPVLAITEAEDLVRLIGDTKAGVAVEPGNTEKAAQALISLFQSRDRRFEPDNEAVSRFDRRLITARLADLFNDLVSQNK